MFSLHTGLFARMLTVVAVIGLVMGGVSVEAMPQMANASAGAPVMQMSGIVGDEHQHAADMAQQDSECVSADTMMADCSASNTDDQCATAGDCCPHCVTALPAQIDSSFAALPTVQTATPQWRLTSVTPVTEIRPPIYTS